MTRAFLRYAPSDDRRPEPLNAPVVARAVQARIDEVRAWIKPRLPAVEDEEIVFALETAIKHGGADGFRAGLLLRDMFKWPVDMDLCLLLRDSCNALAFALRVETRAWVVRSGLRFPAACNDKIEWADDTGKAFAGAVISIDLSYAAAIVQPMDTSYRAGKPRRVFAEQVYANVTRGEYAAMSAGSA
jgi:hypothetical protein